MIDQKLIHSAVLDVHNILVPSLSNGYHAEVNKKMKLLKRTLALHEYGNFCLSFKLWRNGDADTARPQKCLRVWYTNYVPDYRRFQIISDALRKYKLPYFTNFEYVSRGLRVGNEVMPAIIMDWLEGVTLSEWISTNASSPQKFAVLAQRFLRMCKALNNLGIAHGDLCSENILINKDMDIKLVDYDSLYVREMGNELEQATKGWAGYQHPERLSAKSIKASSRDDYFSQHVIYLSLLAYSKAPSLIPKERSKHMLFEPQDLTSPSAFNQSSGYRALLRINDDEVKRRLDDLRIALSSRLSDVRPLESIGFGIGGFRERTYEPSRRLATHCTSCRYRYSDDQDAFKFCPMCGNARVVY